MKELSEDESNYNAKELSAMTLAESFQGKDPSERPGGGFLCIRLKFHFTIYRTLSLVCSHRNSGLWSHLSLSGRAQQLY